MRKTTQFLAPISVKSTDAGLYDIYPTFPMPRGTIKLGLENLAAELRDQKLLVIDGYVGVSWDIYAEQLKNAYEKLGISSNIIFTHDHYKTPKQIDTMIAPYLNGDDPVFGRITDLTLADWFGESYKEQIQNKVKGGCVNIVMGCGASLVGLEGTLIYIDLPKNELQFRMRAGSIMNLGANEILDNKQGYKRLFFVDWVVLNNQKCEILPLIDYIVDGQQIETPPYTSGEDLRGAIRSMSKNFLRVRPWFEPGAWGGTWMRDNISQLNPDVPNLAWSFELMSLENGLLLQSNGYILEVSFDTLMFLEYKNVLGESAERFRYDFPIRYDFLDTFDGGNLSVQCHPRTQYIKEKFGMPFTQDETYYILDCKDDAQVYLGFQEDINPEEFESELHRSQHESQEIDIERFVQKFPAKKHDLFLIPNGTVHGSGSNNMVLEISSAPYIFTFKMYDWMRVDLDGKPRPINIEHGMQNLYFDRKGDKVEQELISKPQTVHQSETQKIELLPTHPEHFYEIHRYTFTGEITIETNNHANVLMIVEGSSLIVETKEGMQQRFNYAETFIIPAAAEKYRLINESNEPVTFVETRVKTKH